MMAVPDFFTEMTMFSTSPNYNKQGYNCTQYNKGWRGQLVYACGIKQNKNYTIQLVFLRFFYFIFKVDCKASYHNLHQSLSTSHSRLYPSHIFLTRFKKEARSISICWGLSNEASGTILKTSLVWRGPGSNPRPPNEVLLFLPTLQITYFTL